MGHTWRSTGYLAILTLQEIEWTVPWKQGECLPEMIYGTTGRNQDSKTEQSGSLRATWASRQLIDNLTRTQIRNGMPSLRWH